MQYPFNYGLGYYGCNGNSPQNCDIDFSGRCTTPGGPTMAPVFMTGQVSVNMFGKSQQVNAVKAQYVPSFKVQSGIWSLPPTPTKAVGVL